MRRPTALFTAVATLVLWLVFCLLYYPPRVEAALHEAAVAALAIAGLPTVRPQVDGRDVVLVGVVESADSRARAERIVTATAGVHVVENRLEIPAPEPEDLPLYVEIRSRPEGVTLRGTVASETRRDELLEQARELYGGDRVDARLAVDPAVEDGAAIAGGGNVLAVLAAARDSLQVRLDGDSLRLSGTVSSDETRRRIEQRAQAAAPRVRLFFSALVVAEPPPVEASTPTDDPVE